MDHHRIRQFKNTYRQVALIVFLAPWFLIVSAENLKAQSLGWSGSGDPNTTSAYSGSTDQRLLNFDCGSVNWQTDCRLWSTVTGEYCSTGTPDCWAPSGAIFFFFPFANNCSGGTPPDGYTFDPASCQPVTQQFWLFNKTTTGPNVPISNVVTLTLLPNRMTISISPTTMEPGQGFSITVNLEAPYFGPYNGPDGANLGFCLRAGKTISPYQPNFVGLPECSFWLNRGETSKVVPISALTAVGVTSMDTDYLYAEMHSCFMFSGICVANDFLNQSRRINVLLKVGDLEKGPSQCDAKSTPGQPACGSPINISNGDVWITHQDYAVPGLGGGLKLARTWNSLSLHATPPTAPGMFGNGWSSDLEERIQALGTSISKYTLGNGNTSYFNRSASGEATVISPPVQRGTITSSGVVKILDGTNTAREFNPQGHLATIRDRNNNATVLTYDGSNRLAQVAGPGGQSLTFTYQTVGNTNLVASIQDSVGTVATYQYSGDNLVRVTYADGEIDYFYDATNQIIRVEDGEGKVLESHTYDSQGRGLTSSKADGVDSMTVEYPSATTRVLTDSLGRQTTYEFVKVVGGNYLTSINGPGCNTCDGRGDPSFTVDLNTADRLSETDADGNTTTFTYDSNGQMLTKTHLLNGVTAVTWSYTYNSFGQVLTVTDPLGNITTNTYDAVGNLIRTVLPHPDGTGQGPTTEYAYDAKGQLLTVKNLMQIGVGNDDITIAEMTYYPSGLPKTVKDADAKITTYNYDGRGNVTSIIDPVNGSAKPTTFQYDVMNRLTRVTHPDSSFVQYGYDHRGRRTSVTDGNGKATQYAYDDADRRISVTDAQQPFAGITAYQYDTESNLTEITDALGRNTTFIYDPLGNVTQTIFVNGSEFFTYDPKGNLKTNIDRRGHTTTYDYDSLDRLTSKLLDDGTQFNYARDLMGRMTQVSGTAANGTYAFSYDDMGRLKRTDTTYSFLPSNTWTVQYTYDNASNRKTMVDPQNATTTYSYDDVFRLTSLASPQGTFGFEYDALGRRTKLSRPGANNQKVTSTYTYDPASRLLSVLHKKGNNTLDGTTYTYDPAGNRLTRTDNRIGVTAGFTYDNIYQLTNVTQGGPVTETYTYDPVGNRLSSLGGVTYGYNNSNQLTGNTGATYTYDGNGNMLTKLDASGTTTYTWDLENRLSSVTLPGSGGTVSFKYDPLGRRIQKSGPGGTVNYVYDGDNVLEEISATGAVLARYTEGLGVDEHLAMLRSGTTSFYGADGLGSVTSLFTTSGTLAKTYTYDSFGKLTASTGSIVNPFQYTGREFDVETGLYYYRARYYAPQIGRFISEDPIGFDGGDNFYHYVDNRPTRFADPFGLQSYAQKYGAIGAAVGAGIVTIGSVGVDAATGGVNILATPAEVASGAVLGAYVGYGVGSFVDYLHFAKGGPQNILPSWVKARPAPGQSGKDFAKEQCDQRYGRNNYPTGPGSEYAKIKKWVDK